MKLAPQLASAIALLMSALACSSVGPNSNALERIRERLPFRVYATAPPPPPRHQVGAGQADGGGDLSGDGLQTRPRAAEDIIAVRRSMNLEHRSAFGVVPTLERRTRLRDRQRLTRVMNIMGIRPLMAAMRV